jgi:hypothetical protein
MSKIGINTIRLNWLGAHGGPGTRISEQPDGTWVAVPSGGPESEEDISRGATPEEAATARCLRLEAAGVYIPDPPADYIERISRE